ncbi:zinc-binding protein A33-like [Protopterus annectens]|uniref:zinc-binding protein A33-like n=1 Tax=Protopterus annectens TaxID=7888 RepID=UPI001CF9C870|nr:zinc-binding protein A33-like [Protopterus annectens]
MAILNGIPCDENEDINFNHQQQVEFHDRLIFLNAFNQDADWVTQAVIKIWGLPHLTLDPKTAHPNLILSDDLTSVINRNVKELSPDNPERYNLRPCVLASQDFTSGIHYWEVKVGCKTYWELGVTRNSSIRKGQFDLNPNCGYWAIVLRSGNEYWAQDSTPKNLNLSAQPKKVGVYLDYEGGQVSFYNADDMSHLYTFTNTFTETLYAFFSPCNNCGGNLEPLKVLHL